MHILIFFATVILGFTLAYSAINTSDKSLRIAFSCTGILLLIFSICFYNSDYFTKADQQIKDKYHAIRDKENMEASKTHPPKLVSIVKNCEIWSFYMNDSDNHYLAICPNSSTSISYPSGKNNSETISTESH